MITPRACGLLLCAIAAAAAPGCALFSKGDQGAARYFSLGQRASARPARVPADAPGAGAEKARLRLGHVTGAPYLEERLLFRGPGNEIVYYRELRWVEPPEEFLKLLLARVLFEERGLEQVVGGAGPTLDVELTALDEIRATQHVARAQAVARLHDDHSVLWEETLTAEIPIADRADGDLATAAVEALGKAVRAVADTIADRVVQRIEVRP